MTEEQAFTPFSPEELRESGSYFSRQEAIEAAALAMGTSVEGLQKQAEGFLQDPNLVEKIVPAIERFQNFEGEIRALIMNLAGKVHDEDGRVALAFMLQLLQNAKEAVIELAKSGLDNTKDILTTPRRLPGRLGRLVFAAVFILVTTGCIPVLLPPIVETAEPPTDVPALNTDTPVPSLTATSTEQPAAIASPTSTATATATTLPETNTPNPDYHFSKEITPNTFAFDCVADFSQIQKVVISEPGGAIVRRVVPCTFKGPDGTDQTISLALYVENPTTGTAFGSFGLTGSSGLKGRSIEDVDIDTFLAQSMQILHLSGGQQTVEVQTGNNPGDILKFKDPLAATLGGPVGGLMLDFAKTGDVTKLPDRVVLTYRMTIKQ